MQQKDSIMKTKSLKIAHRNLFYPAKPKRLFPNKSVVGIGVGPFNLSLAALLAPIKNIDSIFFDKQPEFVWHKGLLFADAELQVHYLKDLVSLVDPTNIYSFLNFLAHEKRLYHFITANFNRVTRHEFNQYFRWVCQQLSNINFNCPVKEIVLHDNQLRIRVESIHETFYVPTSAVVMGIGLQPYVPSFAKKYLSRFVFHASEFLQHSIDFTNKRVAIIGGGQTSAEIVKYLIHQKHHLLKELLWINKRDNELKQSFFSSYVESTGESHVQ